MSSPVNLVQSGSLEARAVHLWRGERHLLRGVSFQLHAGELLQIMGPNGVGKTSLLRCVAGLMPMESGEIHWDGAAVQGGHREKYQQQLVYLAHVNALKNDLTAAENLRYSVGLRREVDAAKVAAILEKLQIAACEHLPVRSLSAGQKRRLAIGRVVLSQARLWILDEPVTNLDTAGIRLFESLMADHLSSGGMILTAAHQFLLEARRGVRTLELN